MATDPGSSIAVTDEEEDFIKYLPMYKAALKGDWESAERFLALHPEAATARLTRLGETALHIAVGTGHSLRFVEKLVDLVQPESLELKNKSGETALAYAAIVANTKAAEILVKKNRNLPQLINKHGHRPLHRAAQYAHKETVRYLLSVTRDEHPSPYAGERGVRLVNFLIVAEFYDVALDVLRINPQLAISSDMYGQTALYKLATRPASAFKSGCKLGFWQQLIYPCFFVDVDDSDRSISRRRDIESSPSDRSAQMPAHFRGIQFNSVCRKLNVIFWRVVVRLAPSIKRIHDSKLKHKHSHELLNYICEESLKLGSAKATELLQVPMLFAAISGIPEFVTHIIKSLPCVIWSRLNEEHNIFHLAVIFRQEKVFNLIYQVSSHKHFIPALRDKKNNNILHLAGNLAPEPQLNSVSGAALQMQRELQWFHEVEKIVQPSYKEYKNNQGQTPKLVFSEAHKGLVKEGEQWMKDRANSCMLVATLIATVLFAAAFTVPGGNDDSDKDKGIPIFLGETSFMVFAVSDALGLFSSATSILMFLSVLTSRYAEEDFLEALPNRMIIGLITLFFSIAAMVTAFSATLFIVLSHRLAWVAIPVALLACVPVALFARLQFRLLVKMVKSTYGPKIFYQQSKEIIY